MPSLFNQFKQKRTGYGIGGDIAQKIVIEGDIAIGGGGFLFKNQVQIIYQLDYTSVDARLGNGEGADYTNVLFNTFQSDALTKTKVFYDSTLDIYVGPLLEDEADGDFVTVDEFDDASIDLAIWDKTAGVSQSDVSESGGQIICKSLNNGVTMSVTTDNVVGSTYTNYIRVKIADVNAQTGSSTRQVRMGSTVVFDVPDNGVYYTCDILIVNGVIYAYDTFDQTWERKGLAGNGKLQFRATRSAASVELRADWFRKWPFTATPLTECKLETTTALDTKANVVTMIGTFNTSEEEPEMAMSANDGVTYVIAKDSDIAIMGNTGKKMTAKFTWTTPGDSFWISEYAVVGIEESTQDA